jgi:hypothetical protein
MALVLRPSPELGQNIAPEVFDGWISSGGPARRALLQPLRATLRRPPAPPSTFLRCIEPLRWLIDEGRSKGLPLDGDGFLSPRFAVSANRRFGFTSPETLNGERTVLEVDQLLNLGYVIRAFETKSRRAMTTVHGRCYLSDVLALWQTAASFICAVPPPGGLTARVWEITLAWLLQPDVGAGPLNDAVLESLGPEDPHPDDDGFEETMSVGVLSLYTLARGLDMFTEPDPSANRPLLSEMGRGTARASLRAVCIHGDPHPDAQSDDVTEGPSP